MSVVPTTSADNDALRDKYEPVVEIDQWGRPLETNSMAYCGPVSMRLINLSLGYITSFPMTCKNWSCMSGCGVQRVRTALILLNDYFLKAEQVWYGRAPADMSTRKRINRRVARGGDVEYILVERYPSRYHIFSTAPISGRLEPTSGVWLDASDAYDTLHQVALVVPGVVRVSGSREWHPPARRERREPEHARIAPCSDRVWERALEIASERAFGLYGVRPNEHDPQCLPVPVWRALLIEAVKEARNELRAVTGVAFVALDANDIG